MGKGQGRGPKGASFTSAGRFETRSLGDGFGSGRSGSGTGALNGSYNWLYEHLSTSRSTTACATTVFRLGRDNLRKGQ
jgi:hypothetical protein